MKKLLYSFILYSLVANAQDCKEFEEGIFESKNTFGTIIIERKGDWQLERSVEYGAVYLNKTKAISECKYEIRYYKVINRGVLPSPDVSVYAITEIVDIIDNKFYLKSIFSNTKSSMEDKYTKVSDEISDDFKKLIANEK